MILLTCSSLSLQECCNNQVYTDNERPSSCKEILAKYPATPSGYYWLQSTTDPSSSYKVYCDMDNERCGSKGWARVAHVDTYSDACPGNLTLISDPIRSCGGLTGIGGCASAEFSTHGISYSQVCGRVRGYQIGGPEAFGPYLNDQANLDLIMDGVLISHGSTQEHIWAYATAYQKTMIPGATANYISPCAGPRFDGVVQPFIGNDYYCDSGVDSDPKDGEFYTTPLWTGDGCTPPNFCCSRSGMPWFCKTLPVPTTDYIELRNCHNEIKNEDTALDLIEIYIS